MAIATGNLILNGVSGTWGRQFVVRQRNGKTVICKMPKPYEKPATEGQLANRQRFKAANDFAKAAIADPVKKAYYQSKARKGQSAFNVAFREAFHRTGGTVIDTDVQQKRVTVKTPSGPEPDSVKVAIVHDMGFEEETGFAVVKVHAGGWVYDFKTNPIGMKIRIYLRNGAGVEWISEIIFPDK